MGGLECSIVDGLVEGAVVINHVVIVQDLVDDTTGTRVFGCTVRVHHMSYRTIAFPNLDAEKSNVLVETCLSNY